MRYLTAEELLFIHFELIEGTGGSHGVRDVHLLGSILEKPKMGVGGTELLPTVFDKAAAYLEAIARYHVFVDGNKRTAVTVAARFLYLNGFELAASNRDVEEFTLRVIEKRLEIETVSAWLENHARPRGEEGGRDQREF